MEFTNTFQNGLHKDNNVLLQPAGTYRDMQNGMLVANDGNHYVVELPRGTRVSFTIPPIYNGVFTSLATIPSPIGFISFLDVLVVFSTNSKVDVNTGGYGEIGIVTFDKDGTGTYLPLYNHPSLNLSMFHQIRGFTYEENDRIKRVYWTDDFNEPRVLNINDSALNPVSSGSLVTGTEYMVTGGAITHNAVVYGPGLTAGNVFTATGANFTSTAGSPIVTQYINYNILNWTPDRILPEIDFNQWVSGALYGGSKSYFVRYINSELGITTSWSYGSFPINVHNIASTISSPHQAEGSGSGGVLQTTSTGVELKISGIDTIYNKMEVAVAEYDQNANTLRSANIFTTVDITGSTMLVQHNSELGGTELTLNDLTLFPASILRVRDLSTNKNYNIIGNITERNELSSDFVATNATISDLTYAMPTDEVSAEHYVQMGSNGITASGSIKFKGKYVVTGGVIRYGVNEYGTAAPLGQFFEGVAGGTNYTVVSGTPVVTACILIKRYQTTAGFDEYKYVPLDTDYWDYRGMAATQYLRQYWGGETYRIGVLPYDKKGNPFYVRWIGDHVVQSYTAKGGPMVSSGASPLIHALQINGLTISDLAFTAEDVSKMGGFSIVRAPRDKQAIAQGIMFQTTDGSGSIRPQPLNTLGYAFDYTTSGLTESIFNWISPDHLLGTQSFAPGGNFLEGECYLSSYDGNKYRDVSEAAWTKYYAYAGTQPNNKIIVRFDGIEPNGNISNYFSGFAYDNSAAKTTFDAQGMGGIERTAMGSKTAVITLDSGLTYPNGNPMNSNAELFNITRPLYNYKIGKSNLYGGTTPAALANTIYITTGHYQPINSTVLADVYDPTAFGGAGGYVFNDIEVFGGDSFLGIYDSCKSMFANPTYANSFDYAVFFPVESGCNHILRQGRHVGNKGMHNDPDGVYFASGSNQKLEEYGVNDGYGSDGSIIAYPALPEIDFVNTFPYRVRWAGPKTLGETFDSFRTFLTNNFRDLDGNKGQINNVRSTTDKLFYWQDHSVGYLPILERQVIGGAVGEATQLGVGGVIDRFDNINTYFGNQHTNGLVETEYGFAWFDFRRKAFLVMSTGGGVQEVSFVKGLQTFFADSALFYASQLTNSGLELANNDMPLIGIGITGVYNPIDKMTYITFKWVEGEDEVSTMYKNITVGYYHPRNMFIMNNIDLKGAIYKNHNDLVIGAKNVNIAAIQSEYEYFIGDNIKKDNIEYVAIANFTTHNPVQAYEQPDYVGSIYWAATFKTNETHLLFNTGSFCKFFGQVYNHSIEVVINPKTGEPFAVDNFKQGASDVNYDVVYCETDDDNATETTNNRFYRYIDKVWQSSVPLGAKGRLVDKYLKVTFTLNNYITNPTISRNLQKLFEYLKSTIRIKR